MPVLKLEKILQIITEMIQKCDVEFSDVSWTELAKYLKVVDILPAPTKRP